MLSDPRVDHAATFPKRMSRLLTLRQTYRTSQRRLSLVTAIASYLVIADILILVRLGLQKSLMAPETAVVSQTVNLWDVGTIRDEQPGPLQSVILPAVLVKPTVVLPHYSSPGRYSVVVSQDQNGNGTVAQG